MKETRFNFKTLLLVIIILALSCGIASAGPPPLPSDYSGYVTINVEPAPDGALVFAKIEDYTSDSVTVTNGGYRHLVVAPTDSNDIGKTIEFYVDPDSDGPIAAILAAETDTFEPETSPDPFNLTVVIVDSTPPVIVSISSSEVTMSGAKITWITDELSTSQVEYGKTTAYGSQKTSPALVTSHSITLTGLEEGTTYHFRVVSTDEEENTAHSGDHTFKTATTSPPPSPPPMTPPPTNEAPVADAGPDKTVYVDVAIHLNGAGSHDPDGTIEEYHWSPGDGSYKPGVKTIHIYGEAGVYTASLSVLDNNGATSTDDCTITVLPMPAPPTALIFDAIPANSTGYVVDASSWADTTVKVNTTDPVTVTVIKYETNPHPGDPMPGEGVPKYADVFVSDPDAVDWPIYIEMTYTDEEVEGLEESSLGMYYWTDGAWQRCSDTGVDTERNVVWAYMTAEEAAGSPILMGGMPAIITPPLPPFFSNLIITPEELELWDNVTISFDIMNPNDGAISYGFEMEIGEITFPLNVELEAYESKTISRTIFPTAVGTYNITVIGMTGNFTVKAPPKPAEFEVSDLSIEPEEAELEEGIDDWNFEITVYVTNVGEQEGNHTVLLRVDDSINEWIASETVRLEGGEKALIIFDVTRGAGSYTVEVDGLTGGFEVKAPPKPAEFEFSNLRIFYPGVIPPEVERDQTVTVTVSIEVENVGELEGDHTVELKVDGELIDSKGVTLEGGASTTVLFELTRGEGTHEVEVEGFKDSFTVNPKPTFWDKIPGFPYESITLGLVAVIIILWYTRARSL